jgi:uncharacterized membrane protein YdbT with pleckstrin-like domain
LLTPARQADNDRQHEELARPKELPVAFPEDILTRDEHVVLHLHPHWKLLIGKVLALILIVVVVLAAFAFLPPAVVGVAAGQYAIGGVALVLLLWLVLWPLLVWRATHFVFTNERVVIQHGVFSRDRRDIPLARVNDHSMDQSFVERLLGCGTLIIESAGERGQSVLTDIPHVERVQTTLYELVEEDRDRSQLDRDELRDVLRDERGQS